MARQKPGYVILCCPWVWEYVSDYLMTHEKSALRLTQNTSWRYTGVLEQYSGTFRLDCRDTIYCDKLTILPIRTPPVLEFIGHRQWSVLTTPTTIASVWGWACSNRTDEHVTTNSDEMNAPNNSCPGKYRNSTDTLRPTTRAGDSSN